MTTVKLFGVLRLKTGVHRLEVEAKDTLSLLQAVSDSREIKNCPSPLSFRELKDCIIAVNGKAITGKVPLDPEDEVMLMTPAGGG